MITLKIMIQNHDQCHLHLKIFWRETEFESSATDLPLAGRGRL